MSKTNKNKSASEEQKYSYLYQPNKETQNMILAIRSNATQNSILTTKEAIDLAIKKYYEEMIACKDTN